MDDTMALSTNGTPAIKAPMWMREIQCNSAATHPTWAAQAAAGIMEKWMFVGAVPPPMVEHRSTTVALFRDGSITDCATGAAASIRGMCRELRKHVRLLLFYCLRGGDDPMTVESLEALCHADCLFDGCVLIHPHHFYDDMLLLKGLLVQHGVSVCHLDSAESVVWQHPGIAAANARTIFEVHNVESALYKDAADRDYIRPFEEAATRLCDAILVRSNDDADHMRRISPECDHKLHLYRGSVALPARAAMQGHADERTDGCGGGTGLQKRRRVGFIGNLRYPPNFESVRKLLPVIEALPDVVFDIVGKFNGNSVHELFSGVKNVFVHGYVAEHTLAQLMEDWFVGVAPIVSGSGTCVKIIDYAAHSIPVLCTSMAARGIDIEDATNAFVCNDDLHQWPRIIAALQNDPARWSAQAAAGYRFVAQCRSWASTINDVLAAYDYATNPGLVRLTFEGMPRCMKTTTFDAMRDGRLMEGSEMHNCQFYVEPSFSEAHLATMTTSVGDESDSVWFLDAETHRFAPQKQQPTRGAVVADRSYLTTLAYDRARSQMRGIDQPGVEPAVEAAFVQRIGALPRYTHVVVFGCSVDASIGRRTQFELSDPATALWVHPSFMHAFRAFYETDNLRRFLPASTKLLFIDVHHNHNVRDTVSRVLQFVTSPKQSAPSP